MNGIAALIWRGVWPTESAAGDVGDRARLRRAPPITAFPQSVNSASIDRSGNPPFGLRGHHRDRQQAATGWRLMAEAQAALIGRRHGGGHRTLPGSYKGRRRTRRCRRRESRGPIRQRMASRSLAMAS